MKQFFISLLLLCGLWPFSSIAQIGVADPVTGNASINFYGIVVDQDGNPLKDAKIDIDVAVGEWKVVPQYPQQPFVNVRTDKMTLGTGADGIFKIDNLEGHGIELKISKEGYELSRKVAHSYYYSTTAEPFHPDSNNPVVFKMWKKIGAEQLVQPRTWNGNVPCDGTTNRFDVLRGRRSGDGNLEIACTRTPLSSPPPGNGPFDYKLQLTVVGGGIQTTEDEFTYLAPENGYLPSITIAKKAGEPGWKGRLTQEFYIKTDDGHYGRLSIDWYSWQNSPTHLDWNCSINPSGSRNLER